MKSKPKKRIVSLLLAMGVSFGCGWEIPALIAAETTAVAPTNSAPPSSAPANPAPPPSAPAKRSAAELEKLVAPIALYPDPLIATMLPASVYPLEIVQAARFVADTNNLAKLDEQSWDDNVKAVAQVPQVIKQMNDDLQWTISLGEAFLAQDKDVMDAIQSMRGKAEKAGTLKTTPQQIVTVTNTVVEKTVQEKVVVVTNTVVQIAPASSTTVYVPTYNPAVVYYPPPAYYVNPYPLLTFGAGMAMGAIIANNCDWWGGGCYHSDVNVNVDRNVNRNVDRNTDRNTDRNRQDSGQRGDRTGNRAGNTSQKKWQPDQSRLNKSGAPSASTRESRGWGGGPQAGQRPSTGSVGSRPSTGSVGSRPSTGTVGARPSTGGGGAGSSYNFSQRPAGSAGATGGQRPGSTAGASRPSPSQGSSVNRSSPSGGGARSSPSVNRSSSGGSAFSGVNSGSSARNASSRGAASRSGGGARGGGGGGRGGGRR